MVHKGRGKWPLSLWAIDDYGKLGRAALFDQIGFARLEFADRKPILGRGCHQRRKLLALKDRTALGAGKDAPHPARG